MLCFLSCFAMRRWPALCSQQKTAYDMRISDWSSDVCSSDLQDADDAHDQEGAEARQILLGRIAIKAEAKEGRRGREESRRDRRGGTGQEDRRHRQAHHRGITTRSEEHTSELQSLMRISYAVFCLKQQPLPRKPTQNRHIRD